MARYEVDHFQLNCSVDSVGDSAICLLVFKDPAIDDAATPPKFGTICSAILIDGGDASNTANLIEKTLGEIERTYSFTSDWDPPRLQLNGVVITHWDLVSHIPMLRLHSK